MDTLQTGGKMNEKQHRARIQELLAQYDQYKRIDEEIAGLRHATSPGGIIVPAQQEELDLRILTLEQARQEVSDSMRFDTPQIWMGYKATAYAGTPSEIRTLGAFLEHCLPPGHICKQRMDYLQAELTRKGKTLGNGALDLSTPLEKAATSPLVIELCEDPALISDWQRYEFNKQNGKNAKWKNYEVNT